MDQVGHEETMSKHLHRGASWTEGRAALTELAIAEPRMNGPEGDAEFWHSNGWSREETSVRRLRQRIFRAAREGDMKQVRNLQRLMLRSRANTLTSVRRVCQVSTGKKTAGIDGQKALTPRTRVPQLM